MADKFSHHEEQAQTGRPGRTRKQKQIIDPDLLYATVDKTREHLWWLAFAGRRKISAVIITILGVLRRDYFLMQIFTGDPCLL